VQLRSARSDQAGKYSLHLVEQLEQLTGENACHQSQ